MEKLLYFFTEQGFNRQEAAIIASHFTYKEIRKGDYFIQEGKTSKHLGFVEKGFLHYYIVLDGEEKTTYSVGENNFIASLVSFLKGIPSRESIRAVVDSSLWIIERKALQQLLQSLPSFQTFYTALLEWQICCIDESRLDAIMLTAKERYLKMLEKEPTTIQNIPLQYLASILGITPRHLSRIRNSIRRSD